ncbi:aspartic peptidase domain-containing protein [Coemansia spiralis]|nr:aspartic peptidase domain-containing protein [Coemansia spiralis]
MSTIRASNIAKGFGGQYIVECSTFSKLPQFTLQLGGKDYTLDAEDYILNIQGICLSGFTGVGVSESGSSIWIIGNVFLRKFYFVFDLGKNRIGFAKAL